MPDMLKLTILDRAAQVRPPVAGADQDVYVWRDVAGNPCAYGHTVGGRHWMHWPRLASYCFDDDGGEILAYRSESASPGVIVDTFHRMVLPLALQRRGMEALHASATMIHGRVVAFCAVSGTGKSTLAYSLHRAGYRQWSDDVVVFDVREAEIAAVPLPFDVRLLPQTAARFAGPHTRLAATGAGDAPSGAGSETASEHSLEPVSGTASGESSRQSSGPASIPASGPASTPAPLGAVCVLVRRTRHEFGSEVGVERLSSARALAAVLEHAHCFSLTDPARKKAMLQHYFDLVERVPVFEVRFRPGLDRLPGVIDGLVAALLS